MKIKTNNTPRLIIDGYQLTEEEKKEFGYMDNIEEGAFFRYKNQVYDLNDFMRVPEGLKPWHGYAPDSYFSAIVVRYADSDHVVVGTCFQ